MIFLNLVLAFVLIMMFITEILSYRNFVKSEKKFEEKAKAYEETFNSYATTLILVSEGVKLSEERQKAMIQHLTEMETIVAIHSDALKTRLLVDLVYKELPDLTIPES